MHKRNVLIALGILTLAATATAIGGADFGLFRDRQLDAHSEQLFGIVTPVETSSTDSLGFAGAESNPAALVTLAKGLHVRVVTASANAGANIDMMALWPNDTFPTHLIACNEQGTVNPGVQRIRLSDGFVETILTGTSSCDPVRRTAWGTIIVGEELVDGWLIEMMNPLNTTGVLFNRAAGTFSGGVGATNLVTRPAVGRLAFEGLALYPNRVIYYGDENRRLNGTPGGAYSSSSPARPGLVAPSAILPSRRLPPGRSTDSGSGSAAATPTTGKAPRSRHVDTNRPSSDHELASCRRNAEADRVLPAGGCRDRPDRAAERQRALLRQHGERGSGRTWGETICVTDGTPLATQFSYRPVSSLTSAGWL